MKRHHLGLFFVCIAAAASASCSEGTDNSTCTDGAYKCVINTLNKCVDGQWQNETTCSATQTCNETEGRCVPNSAEQPPTTDQCYPDGVRQCVGSAAVRECRNKKWETVETCNDDQTCNDITKSCTSKANPDQPSTDSCPQDGMNRCIDHALQECIGNKWKTIQTCNDDQTCNESTKSCDSKTNPNPGQDTDPPAQKECNNGSFKCEKLAVYECRNDHWVHVNTCVTGTEVCNAQTGKCDPDTQLCTDGHEKCNDDLSAVVVCKGGAFVEKEKCDTGKACLGAQCIETTTCDPTTKDSCDGNVSVRCRNGAIVRQDCGDDECVVRGDNATCEQLVCEDGSVDCKDDGTKRVCQNNAWIEKACNTDTEICSAGACVERTCKEGAKRCENNAVEVCQNNAWTVETQCNDQMCQNNACVNVVCSTGDMRCDARKIQTCDNNQFTTTKTCSKNEVCIENGKRAECKTKTCTNGTKKCSGNKLQVCQNYEWTDKTDCAATNMICDNNSKSCKAPECTEGAKKCSTRKKTVMICKNGQWTEGDKCWAMTPNQTCKEENNTATCVAPAPSACTEGTTCEGNTLVICTGGQKTTTDCSTQPAPGTCVKSGTTASCNPYECTGNGYKCFDNTLKQCNPQHKYQKINDCKADQTCNETSGKCDDHECSGDNVFKCDGNVLKKCINHKYETVSACAQDTTCDASAPGCTPNACKANEYSCNGKTLRECKNNQWSDKQTCTNNQECDSAKKTCVDHECEGTSYACDGKTLKRCENYKLVEVNTCTDTQECDKALGKCVNHECEYKERHAYCDGQTPKVCENYKITSGTTCTSAQICDNSKGQCIARTCQDGNYMCTTDNKLQKCEGNAWKLEKQCQATETCNATQKKCELKPVCTKDDMRCNGNEAQKCNAQGQWQNDTTCNANQVCEVKSKTQALCTDKWELPGWCIFQAIDKFGRGYGRIRIPESVDASKIKAEFVCGSATQPVSTWKTISNGIDNPNCNNCGPNKEYMTPSIPLAPGNYACAFSFVLGPETIYCPTADVNKGWIIKTDALVLDAQHTLAHSVRSIADDDAIAWCKGGTVKEGENAYIQALLPKEIRGSQAQAKIICGDKDKLPSTWTKTIATHENLLCNNCGDNIEYMTDAITGAKGNACATIITFGKKSYACKIGGDNPVEFKTSEKLADDYLSIVAQ